MNQNFHLIFAFAAGKRSKIFLLFFAALLNAVAQMIGLPDAGVTLVGTPTAPVIVNGSSHRIVRYTIVEQGATGVGQPHTYDMIRQFIKDPNAGIAPGSAFSDALHLPQRPQVRNANGEPPPPTVQVSLDSILFENGFLVGPDKFNSYDSITAQLQARRDVAEEARAGNWSKLQQIVLAGEGNIAALAKSGIYARIYRLFIVSTARGVLLERERSGDSAAVKLAADLASFPMIGREQ